MDERKFLDREKAQVAQALEELRQKRWEVSDNFLAVDTTTECSKEELEDKISDFLEKLTKFRLRFPDISLHANTRHAMAPFIRATLHLMAEDAVDQTNAHRANAEEIAEQLSAIEAEIEAEDAATRLLDDVVEKMVRGEAENIAEYAADFEAYVNEIVDRGLELKRDRESRSAMRLTKSPKKRMGFIEKIKNLFK
jgi:KaiC/GvpD/RAD55 family RecA-like ATPase